MNKVVVNGKIYNLPNGSVSVINNKVYHNGKLVTDCDEIKEKEIKITIEGDACDVSLDCGEIIVKGNCNNVKSKNGNVEISGDVSGNASTTNGNIKAKTIYGDCKTTLGSIKGASIQNSICGANINGCNNYVNSSSKRSGWFSNLMDDIFG